MVTIRYTLRGEDGGVIESNATSGSGGLAYLHGSGNIVPGLERALEGQRVGYGAEVEVPAVDGYGEVE
ncbi:MAG: FKBP-type peptidyl-prolyl cis-trans isomerase, partial [Verrucomicrobiales bacterium]|nr:FKBP-type peptidyl-prolyl cis-trans isomerase [Verrucomicrobiales bacterium]